MNPAVKEMYRMVLEYRWRLNQTFFSKIRGIIKNKYRITGEGAWHSRPDLFYAQHEVDLKPEYSIWTMLRIVEIDNTILTEDARKRVNGWVWRKINQICAKIKD